MEIYWLGHGCFRLRGREATVLTDPCPPSTGYKIGKVPADLVTISHDDPDSNFEQAIQGEPKVVNGPGEYEIAGVLITGLRTDRNKGKETMRNIAFVFDIDDIKVCHLGASQHVPSREEVEAFGEPDILLLPVGGGGALSPSAAAETVSVLEPKIVIPMRYKTDVATADLEALERFLKEIGAEAKPPESRLSITKSNIPSDTSVIVLNYRG